MKKVTNVLGVLTVVLLSLFAAACNTMEGAGQDVQKAGQKIEESANDAK
jgi:predicted small secreted protein